MPFMVVPICSLARAAAIPDFLTPPTKLGCSAMLTVLTAAWVSSDSWARWGGVRHSASGSISGEDTACN